MNRASTALVVSLAAALSFSALPAQSGLGDAVEGNAHTYAAWCGRKGNDCTVTVDQGRIVVNNKDSIEWSQLRYLTRDRSADGWGLLYTFGLEYEENNQRHLAKVLFANPSPAERFWRDVKRACIHCEDRGAGRTDVELVR